jgi:tight adherence protein C
VPSHMLDGRIKQRQLAIRRALPDVIDLLVVSVEAGLGLDGAMQEVLTRRRGPLLDEFARVLAEVRVGKPRRKAWQEMAERGDTLELKVFVAAIVQAEELGASIAGVMRGQSESLRMRRSLSVREVAAVLPIKMLFPLIFFIFPSMFVVILGPGMITLFTTFKSIGF